MKRATLALVLAVACSVQASETPPPEYRTAMKDLEAASEIMRHHARMVEPGGDFGYDWIESDADQAEKRLRTGARLLDR